MKDNSKKYKWMMRIFPFYQALAADFAFWIIIDTLWLSEVRNIAIERIAILDMMAVVSTIVLMIIIQKIINAHSSPIALIRVGSLLGILSPIIMILSGNEYLIVIAMSLRMISKALTSINSVVLRNTLLEKGEEKNFVKVKSKGNFYYAILTIISAMFAGVLWKFNMYLPLSMDACLKFIAFILSFTIYDAAKNKTEKIEDNKITNKEAISVILSKKYLPVIVLIISYSLIISILGQTGFYTKLQIQGVLGNIYTTTMVVTITGWIAIGNRLSRLVSAVIYPKVNNFFKSNIISFVIIVIICMTGLGFTGVLLKTNFRNLSLVLLILAYTLIPAIRQGALTSFHEKIMVVSDQKQHSKIIYLTELCRSVGDFVIVGLVALILNVSNINVLYGVIFMISIMMYIFYKKFSHNEIVRCEKETFNKK